MAALLGVSVGSVRRLEGKELHPDVAADGTHLFLEDEVRQLAASRKMRPSAERDAEKATSQIDEPAPTSAPPPEATCTSAPPPTASATATLASPPGTRAATAFALFNAGIGPREAVVELDAEPTDMRRFHEQWLAMGADLVIPATIRQEIEGLVGDALSVAKLVAVIRRLVKCWEERHAFSYPCAGCGKEIEASPEREWKALVGAGCLTKWRHAACHALTSTSGDVDDDGNEGLDGEDGDGDGE